MMRTARAKIVVIGPRKSLNIEQYQIESNRSCNNNIQEATGYHNKHTLTQLNILDNIKMTGRVKYGITSRHDTSLTMTHNVGIYQRSTWLLTAQE